MTEAKASEKDSEKRKDPKEFEIKVIYNGVEKELEVKETDTVQAVLQAAIKLFPVTEQQHLLALFDAHGVEITNEAQTVKAAGLKTGSRLILRQSAVKGG